MRHAPVAGRAERLLDGLLQALAVGGLLCLTGIALATVVDVLLRWLLSAPIEGLTEVMSLAAAVTIASFLPISLKTDGHAKIRALGRLAGVRGGRILDAFAALATFGFFCVLAWQMARYTLELASSGERTWILQLNPTPWWALVTGFVIIAAIAQAGVVILRLVGRPRASGSTAQS